LVDHYHRGQRLKQAKSIDIRTYKMAVYTVLDQDEIEAFIKPFGIGPLIEFEGVAAGIENTNYFLSTDQSDFPSEFRTEPVSHYVLTLFEVADETELAFFIQLTTLLNTQNLPVPCPLSDVDGNTLQYLRNKPALLIPKIAGQHLEKPTTEHGQQIGQCLAKTHQATTQAKLIHNGNKGLDWLIDCANTLKPQLSPEDQLLLKEIPRFQERCKNHPNLPRSVIHGDIFRDNVLFNNNQLSAIIDFNSASNGYLMFDLAVLINDWCSNAEGELDQALCNVILQAYQQQRPFTADEKSLWPDFLRIAAARFWLSRLQSQLLPAPSQSSALVEQKDPETYKNILIKRITKAQTLT
jgi:homoserine kinase type II